MFSPGGSSASTPPSALLTSLAANPRLKTYDMMRKMLPEGAVRQKMDFDGISQAEIDAYFGVSAQREEMNSTTSSSSKSDCSIDPRYEKFVKMMKMLPEGAVRQKMSIENFSEAEIDYFIANGAPAATDSNPVTSIPQVQGPVDPRYEKFVKMQKILPEGPVRQKMSMEGFTDQEIDNFITNGPPSVGASLSSPPTSTPDRGGLMAQIQGQVTLKKTNGPNISKAASGGGGRGGGKGLTLLDQLKGGVTLKSVR